MVLPLNFARCEIKYFWDNKLHWNGQFDFAIRATLVRKATSNKLVNVLQRKRKKCKLYLRRTFFSQCCAVVPSALDRQQIIIMSNEHRQICQLNPYNAEVNEILHKHWTIETCDLCMGTFTSFFVYHWWFWCFAICVFTLAALRIPTWSAYWFYRYTNKWINKFFVALWY